MKKRKNLPLMVVATVKPTEVASIPLKRFSTADGDFITNANLQYIFSPFNGQEIASDEGVEVEDTIDEDEAVGVVCKACNTINATMDHSRNKLSCVACGTHLAFDASGEGIDEEELDDLTESEFDPDQFDADEEAESKDDDSFDEDAEDTDSDEDESEAGVEDMADDAVDDDKLEDDDLEVDEVDSELINETDEDETTDDSTEEETEAGCDNEMVDLTDVVDSDDEEAKASFIQLNDTTIAAIAGGLIVAHMSTKHSSADRALTEAFADGVNQVASTYGLNEALTSAGFKTVKIKTEAALASKMRKLDRKVAASVKEETAANHKHLLRCLDIAAAGGLVGLFKKENASVLFDELTTTLAGLNVVKPRSVARRVLAKAMRKHNAAMLATAETLTSRDESVLAAFEEQIMASDDTQFDNTELEVEEQVETPEEEAVVSRLTKPMLKTEARIQRETETVKLPEISGMFNRF